MVAPLMCNSTCPGNSSATCGGADSWEFYYAPPGTNFSARTDTSVGCLVNSGAGLREQSTYNFSSSALTTAVCLQACADKNTTWALTTNGNQCFCGTNYNIGQDTYVPSDYCSTKCSGNSSETCGFTYRSNVYNLTNSGVTAKAVNKPAGWQGCYSKPSSGSVLSNSSWSSNTMTTTSCINGCNTLGTKYAAVQGGNTCLCGDVANLGASLPASQCATNCAGNSTETCGGSGQLELFNTSVASLNAGAVAAKYPAGWKGCFSHTNSAPALNDYSYTSASMTVQLCKAACQQFGYAYAGVNNGNGCSCGKAAPTTTQVSFQNCNVGCKGNTTEFCGASAYMDIYDAAATSSNTTSPVSSASGYQGCFQDYGSKGLTAYNWKSDKMTIEMCRTGCQYLKYSLAAVENANQCFCGNSWTGGAILPDTSCTSACTGNSTQKCGAPSISSVYNTTGAPAAPARGDGWVGCYTDNASARSLKAYSYSGSMTVGVCRASCAQKGYSLAGLENGNGSFSPLLFCC